MTDELRERMAKLRAIVPRLNSATDQASRLVTMVEKLLADELRIGISAESAPFCSWSPGKNVDGYVETVYQLLAFGRVSGAYRIHVVDETRVEDLDGGRQVVSGRQTTLWPSCGRETKLRAIGRLPELLDTIIGESEKLAETADQTAARIGDMIGDFRLTAVAPEPEVAPQFLCCGSCGERGRWLNVERQHWGVCADCEVKWPIGRNLINSWQNESEEDWRRNAKELARYSLLE